jgi:hypothetical protein
MDYSDFRKQYIEQHPASVPIEEKELNEYPWWVKYATLATFIAVATVSAVHTIPTVWATIQVGSIITDDMRNGAALASFIGIEFTILLSAFLMAKGQFIAYTVMALASIVAIIANLYSSYKVLSSGGDSWAVVLSIVLGVSIPLIALFVGKQFMDIHRADRVQEARSKKAFQDRNKQFDRAIEKAWKVYQKEQKEDFTKFHEEVHENTTSPKTRVKLHEVAKKVHENGDTQLSTEEMMEKYQIGLGSTSKVREILKNQNGHSQDDGRLVQ